MDNNYTYGRGNECASGSGYGNGCGDGSGSGYGHGDGHGCGHGHGSGDGDDHDYTVKSGQIYRDGTAENFIGRVAILKTREGHIVEKYLTDSRSERFFATLYGSTLCAHGDTIADAVANAIAKKNY
jgi:hypothetical protein